MTNDLKPGDLCEIIYHPSMRRLASARAFVGRIVVLIRIYDCKCGHEPSHYPFWVCAGIPGWHASHLCLKKIPPPPPLADDIDETLEHVNDALRGMDVESLRRIFGVA